MCGCFLSPFLSHTHTCIPLSSLSSYRDNAWPSLLPFLPSSFRIIELLSFTLFNTFPFLSLTFQKDNYIFVFYFLPHYHLSYRIIALRHHPHPFPFIFSTVEITLNPSPSPISLIIVPYFLFLLLHTSLLHHLLLPIIMFSIGHNYNLFVFFLPHYHPSYKLGFCCFPSRFI